MDFSMFIYNGNSKMQAILVIKIHDFSGLMERAGINIAVDMVYELRNVSSVRLGLHVSSMCQDTIIAVMPEPSVAMEEAKHIMGILCPQNSIGTIGGFSCTPVCAAIGYGDLFQTVDRSYWGVELTNTLKLVEDAGLREILLTDAAKRQLPSATQDICDL